MQIKCDHPNVTADILEGDVRGQCVQWCQSCGAYRRGFQDLESDDVRFGDWRETGQN